MSGLYPGRMTFGASIASAFRGWISYRGTSSRSEFWWFQLFSLVSFLGLIIVAGIVLGPFGEATSEVAAVILTGYIFVLFIIGLALTARRLRDAGLGWGFLFLHLVPLLGAAILYLLALFPSKVAAETEVIEYSLEDHDTSPPSIDDEVESKLSRLTQLHDAGKISGAQFEAAQKKLLEN